VVGLDQPPSGRGVGRRRVGKTALLQRFAGSRRSVFHTGAGRAAAGELAQLSRQAAVALPGRIRDLVARPYRDWDDALDDLPRRRSRSLSSSSWTSFFSRCTCRVDILLRLKAEDSNYSTPTVRAGVFRWGSRTLGR